MASRILLISPVRNEAPHIERVVRAVAAQTRPPARWIVVDDGSTDDTLALLRALEPSVDFLQVHVREPDGRVVPDRLATAAEARAFNDGLRLAGDDPFTHIAKLDGDVELPPDYFERLLERFAQDAELGLACGELVEPCGGALVSMRVPRHHVHGALKCYSRSCFDSIGGIQDRLGWDTIDGTYARMRGFRTHSFTDLVCIHHRPIGSADGTLRGHARHGECAYIAQYTTLWVALRSMKVGRRRPAVLSGLAFFYGYVRAAVRRVERVPDPEYRRFTRRELRRRMLGAIRPPHHGMS